MPSLSLRTRRLRARGLNARDRVTIGRRNFIGLGNRSTLTTAVSGSNNDVTYTARVPGTGGNSIRVRYVVAGNDTPLSVAVSGTDITVNSATDGSGNPTSTAAQVIDKVNRNADATVLVWAQRAPSNDGTGVIAALGYTALTGAV